MAYAREIEVIRRRSSTHDHILRLPVRRQSVHRRYFVHDHDSGDHLRRQRDIAQDLLPQRRGVNIESAHEYCYRIDAKYVELYHKLHREREHKDLMRSMKYALQESVLSRADRRVAESLYEDLKNRVWQLKTQVEERKRYLLRRSTTSS
jgi:hypothetical protein